ncbi:uncharacterized protein LOC144634603 [Oculina patagonica]
MLSVFCMFCAALVVVSSLILDASCLQDHCRQLEFRADQTFEGRCLMNHVIHNTDVMSEDFCEMLCYMEPNCVSFNIMTRSETGKHKCELNNATHEGHEEDLEANSNYIYRGAKNACLNNLCRNNATCQTGFTDRGYRCLCDDGFEGDDCEKDIDKCADGTHDCDANAECTKTKGSYNCTCSPGYYGDGWSCRQASTCKEIYDNNLYKENKGYLLHIGSEMIPVYCHMDSGGLGENGECGGGGWTLVMKIDGSKATFHYNSDFWSNNETYNLPDGETGFDTEETKLPTYWNTPFSKICLGMKIGQQIKFIVLNKQANSLYSLIADGQYRVTSLGRDTWKSLISSGGSLQVNCNREGFNTVCNPNQSKARIGIVGNNQHDCNSCDSRIGFGTGGAHDDSNTCGNQATHSPDNGNKHIKAMGYILIQ